MPPDAPLAEGLMEMTRKGLGMTAIVDERERVLGVFTDGDLRRALDRAADLHATRMDEVMTATAKAHATPIDARRRGGALDGDPPHHLADRASTRTKCWSVRSTCTICCAPESF